MTLPLAQGDDPLSWRGGWSSAVPRGRRRRYGACCCLPSVHLDLKPKHFCGRPTPCPPVHSEIHARHVFFLSGCTPCPAAEHRVEHALRMASPSGVDHGPRTKRHGCRERSAAGSGSFNVYRYLGDVLRVSSQARASLELMMKRQLELRREETRAIHEFVQSLIERLEAE